MTTKHTPGPWKVRDFSHGSSVEGKNGQDVAWCADSFSTTAGASPFKANARLIAASPDLLAACEEALSHMDYLDVREEGDDLVRYQLRTAISKATASKYEPPSISINDAIAIAKARGNK